MSSEPLWDVGRSPKQASRLLLLLQTCEPDHLSRLTLPSVIAVEEIRPAERLAEIVDHHHGVGADALVAFGLVVDAHEALLRGFVVGVLNEHGEQLERIALRARRAARGFVDLVQVGP